MESERLSRHKKPADECSEKELLIRIDERTQGLPEWKRRVDISLTGISVVLFFVIAKTYPLILSALAR